MAVDSSILKQIKSLRNAIKDQVNYFDVNYKGIDDNESIYVSSISCVIQAFKIWLMSDINDYPRQPSKGGFLVRNVIKKPLSKSNASSIASELQSETKLEFPTINLLKCEVTANIAKRRWEIRIAAQDTRSGLIDTSMDTDNGMVIQYVND